MFRSAYLLSDDLRIYKIYGIVIYAWMNSITRTRFFTAGNDPRRHGRVPTDLSDIE